MKLTWPRFFLGYFVVALALSYPVALYAGEDGLDASQVATGLRGAQPLDTILVADVAHAQPVSPVQPVEPVARVIAECELTGTCVPAPARPPINVIVPPPAESTTVDFMKTIESISILLLAVIGTLLSWPLGKLLGSQTRAKEVLTDLNMGPYATYAVTMAIKWGLHVAGVEVADLAHVEVRSKFFRDVINFLNGQFPEVVTWIQTSGSLEQFVAAHLPAGTPAPVLKSTV